MSDQREESMFPLRHGGGDDQYSFQQLEYEVLEQRAKELRIEGRKQARQRAFLREERKKARDEKDALERDKASLAHAKKSDWFPHHYLPDASEKRLKVNVGGQIFEISQSFVLKNEPDSLLSALCGEDCPQKVAYVDRDWWVFRYVLIFLRDGLLPISKTLVLQLYREASFFRLRTLMQAIEETHLHLTRTKIFVDSDPQSEEFGLCKQESPPKQKSKFWLNKPNWWEAQPPPSKEKKDKPDWWQSQTEWKDRTFGPLSTDPTKVVANKDDVKKKNNVAPMLNCTWGYYQATR